MLDQPVVLPISRSIPLLGIILLSAVLKNRCKKCHTKRYLRSFHIPPYLNPGIYRTLSFDMSKETVPQDILPLFLYQTSPPGPPCHIVKHFVDDFEYAEIFELEIDSAVSMSLLTS